MASKIPTIAMKPSSASSPAGITIQTSKEWVLPPRPKPGRKADTDNAPTKRKAQNRDAQRAFRERRAARVGELEQQIREIEANHRLQLEDLEVEKGRLKMENIRLRDVMEQLNRELNTIRSLTRFSESPEHRMQTANLGKVPSNTSAVTDTQMISPAPSADLELSANNKSPVLSPLRFDNIPGLLVGQAVPLKRRSKRKVSDAGLSSIEYQAPEAPAMSIAEDSEVDYTFSSSSFRPPSGESCGFCSDGTPCLCAETAQQHAIALRRSQACGQQQSDDLDAATDEKYSQFPSKPVESPSNSNLPEDENGLCTGNPGSCRQCQLDPMSNLFCKTLADATTTAAAAAALPGTSVRPPLTTKSSAFSISSARDTTPPRSEVAETYVPCSAAYQTLSQHQNFKESSIRDIVSGLEVDKSVGRGVELSSVRSVLRILDRNFARND